MVIEVEVIGVVILIASAIEIGREIVEELIVFI